MPIFVEARTDPFVEARQRLATSYRERGRNFPVRRPMRGFQIKEPTYAVIRVMGPDGEFIQVIDAAGETLVESDGRRYTTHYTNFLMQSVVEERQEKQQIVETFGDPYIFFFGERPRMLQVNGFLLNTADFNWRAEFWENYDRYFRGTKLVEQGARLYLIYDDIIVEGYMLQAVAQESAPQPNAIQFNFLMFITGYTNISAIGDPNFPDTSSYYAVRTSDAGVVATDPSVSSTALRSERTRWAESPFGEGEDATPGTGVTLTDSMRSSGWAESPFAQDPSTASFLASARRATSGGFLPSPLGGGEFVDNQDEFVNAPGETQAHARAAELLSLDQQWSNAQDAFDRFAYPYFDSTDARFMDLLGRMGQASIEISARGSTSPYVAGTSGATVRASLRTVPYGMSVLPGEI